MGNCFSDVAGGRAAVGGSAAAASAAAGNDALSFSATNMRDRDVLSKSDPMLVVYTKGRDGTLTEAFRTEVVLNSLNPTWIAKHTITFQFEVVQSLEFHAYDVDTQFHNMDVKMLKLEEQQFLGEASCVLSEVVTRPSRSLTLDLVYREDPMVSGNPRRCGQLIVHAEECISSKTTTEMILKCSNLEYKDLFSRSDPFLLISKIVEVGVPIPVWSIKQFLELSKCFFLFNLSSIPTVAFQGNVTFLIETAENPLMIECFNFSAVASMI
uniref:C2 domain-containing protein n=1 Tax=Salix viminalis TaxID=40686 RepID=A0A6N2KVY4_SALVM